MHKDLRILGLIPARSGSKGIINKNIVPLCGKPLIAYTIAAAIKAKCFDEIIVSTDSTTIGDLAKTLGVSVPFLRPESLASDEAMSEDVARHALDELAKIGKIFDILIYLQPTSPLRNATDIQNCLAFFLDNGCRSLATVSPVTEHPLFMRTLDPYGRMAHVLPLPSNVRRQDLPPYYIINGALYINYTSDVMSGYVGNDNLSGYNLGIINGLDINTAEDLTKAESYILTSLHK